DMAPETLEGARARSSAIAQALRTLDLGQPGPRAPVWPGRGGLRAPLTVTGPGDVDIAALHPGRRRLSALRPVGVKVLETSAGETLTLATVRKPLAIEVSRLSGSGPVTGELTLRTPSVTRTYPFTLDQGSLRLANVSYSTVYRPHPY